MPIVITIILIFNASYKHLPIGKYYLLTKLNSKAIDLEIKTRGQRSTRVISWNSLG